MKSPYGEFSKHGPSLVTLNKRCRLIIRTQKGPYVGEVPQ